MGKKMASTNDLPFFAVEAYVPGGGVQNQADKKSEEKKPVPKSTFPEIAPIASYRVIWRH